MPEPESVEMIARGGYADPRTPYGVSLAEVSKAAGGFLFLHETGWQPRGIRWYFPKVLSPFWRLYHNPEPGWQIRHAGRVWSLDPGHVLLIPDGTVFDCEGEAGVPHLWIHFSLAQAPAAGPPAPVALPLTPALRALTADLRRAHGAGLAARQLYHATSAVVHAAFGALRADVVATVPDRLAALLAWVPTRLAEPLTNDVLARRAGLSESAFIRWFRGHVGTSPAAWVQRQRMKHAAHALLMSPQSIEEVATATGFRNRHHFSRVFRQHFHVGPAEYRRRTTEADATGR